MSGVDGFGEEKSCWSHFAACLLSELEIMPLDGVAFLVLEGSSKYNTEHHFHCNPKSDLVATWRFFLANLGTGSYFERCSLWYFELQMKYCVKHVRRVLRCCFLDWGLLRFQKEVT